jgi:large subunit ribosomal protein L4
VKLPVLSIEGKELRKVDVDDSVFGIEPNGSVLHQTYLMHRNNQRAGTASTKTRGEVQGSTRKIRKQKYTGRARAGSERSPTRVGGGTVFGPRPRSYDQDMPKKMRRLAIRSALSSKVADGQLVVIDALALETPQTKEIIRILGNVGIQRSALVVTAQSDRAVLASVRNRMKTKALPAAYLNVADLMNHQGLLITEEAVRIAEGLWGKKEEAKKAPRSQAAPKDGAAAAEKPRAETKAEAEPEAKAPAKKRPAASLAEPEPEAEAVAAAPEAEAAPAEEAPKPKRAPRAKAEKPAAEATTEEKPKRAPRAKKADADAPAADAPAEKPKRAPRAKKGEGE